AGRSRQSARALASAPRARGSHAGRARGLPRSTRRGAFGSKGRWADQQRRGVTMNATAIRVLLIEDNPVHARMISGLLESSHHPRFEVAKVETLREGVDLSHRATFDLALLDLMLPDSEGLDTFLQFHSKGKRMPV